MEKFLAKQTFSNVINAQIIMYIQYVYLILLFQKLLIHNPQRFPVDIRRALF